MQAPSLLCPFYNKNLIIFHNPSSSYSRLHSPKNNETNSPVGFIHDPTINHSRNFGNQCSHIARSGARLSFHVKLTASSWSMSGWLSRPSSAVTRRRSRSEDEFIIVLVSLSFIICGGIGIQQLFRMNCGIKGNYMPGSLVSNGARIFLNFVLRLSASWLKWCCDVG